DDHGERGARPGRDRARDHAGCSASARHGLSRKSIVSSGAATRFGRPGMLTPGGSFGNLTPGGSGRPRFTRSISDWITGGSATCGTEGSNCPGSGSARGWPALRCSPARVALVAFDTFAPLVAPVGSGAVIPGWYGPMKELHFLRMAACAALP